MQYTIKFHDEEILGIKPSTNGWMWPEHDTLFDFFSKEVVNYYNVYKAHCNNFNVAIQAGGHCGMFPKIISSLFKTVYTFEPDGYSFHCLVNNCQSDNIKKFNCALGGEHELVYQTYRGYHNMGVNNYARPKENETPIMLVRDVVDFHANEVVLANIPQIRIDDLGLEHCDLIHLDVEGYEGHIIDGAMKTIEKFKPLLLWESMPQENFDYLCNLGYSKIIDVVSSDSVFKA